MKLIDISWPAKNGMTEYKDRNSFLIKEIKDFKNDGVRESVISFHSHTGTHIDAPSHFLDSGTTIETTPLNAIIGNCRVIDFTEVQEKITAAELEKHGLKEGERILLKTRNSLHYPSDPFDLNFIYLSIDAAQLCAQKKIASIGIDYLGIERSHPQHEVHTILLSAGIVIIEGLRLAHIDSGTYQLICLPLLIPGCDAAPVRALLAED